VTKGIAVEGTGILAGDFADIAKERGITDEELTEAVHLMNDVSVVREALVLADNGATAMVAEDGAALANVFYRETGGTTADAFAHMLVHETSHGFNHRWISPRRLPNWLNEGLAEWVGTQVVPRSRQVPLKEAEARAFMQSAGSLGPGFFTAENIQPVQYGIASQLVRFLVIRDRGKFAEFVRGIKEGMTPEESFQATFDGSLEDLVTAFGRAGNLPGLKP